MNQTGPAMKRPYTAKPATLLLLLAGIFLTLVCTGLPTAAPLLLFFLPVSGALLAYTHLLQRSFLIYLTVPAAYAAALLLGGQPIYAALVLIPAAGSLMFVFCADSGIGKTGTVLRVTAICGLLGGALFLLQFAVAHGAPTPRNLTDVYTAFIDAQKTATLSYITDMLGTMEQAGIDTASFRELYTEQNLSMVFNYLTVILPGLLIAAVMILCYLFVSAVRLLMRLCKTPALMRPEPYEITVSKIAAGLYMLGYVLVVFSSTDSGAVVNAVGTNLVLLFAPGLAAVGVSCILRCMRRPETRRFGILALVLSIAGSFLNPVLGIGCVILVALFFIFARRRLWPGGESGGDDRQ